ncbi:unnamed protein product [Rotaria sp. Silwood1]|nr:unnamed protein product [Rotaria sp. Silwood1]CAF1489171.1 unnamed protein product [Rotaria sp. Silwood1]CAF3647891.1 unnamed protein product [Rotaria sp. Silwood1]CAF4753475.1 unnamed protein product [Rotaria sp. Silwood1]
MARYGRSLRFGTRRQLLGKSAWFQIHRLLLSISSLLILLGFLLILVRNHGQWVQPKLHEWDSFVHSILGGTIFSCSIVQLWLALYRCKPNSRFRFIFNWSHRIVGLLIFGLSIPAMFLMISQAKTNRTVLITAISFWTAWIVIVIIICEKIEYKKPVFALSMTNNARQDDTNQENINTNVRPDTEATTQLNTGSQYHNQIKLLLLVIHIIISVTLSVLLIVFYPK